MDSTKSLKEALIAAMFALWLIAALGLLAVILNHYFAEPIPPLQPEVEEAAPHRTFKGLGG